MFEFPIKIRCDEAEIGFAQWVYAPRVPSTGELLIVGGHEYTVIAVKLRVLTEEEKRDPTSQRVVAATCLVRPTSESEGF